MIAVQRLIVFVFSMMFFVGLAPVQANDSTLSNDFAPRQGVIVGTAGKEVILDLGRESGIIPGDPVQVVRQGAAIVHPVSKETLGFQNEIIGSLQVTRVEEKFSYARSESTLNIEPGTPVHLYDGQQSYWCDSQNEYESDFAELRQSLSALRWEIGCPDTGLVFRGVDGRIEVRNAKTLLRSYPLNRPKNSRHIDTEKTKRDGIVTKKHWYGPIRKEAIHGVTVADLDGDGRLEGVALFSHHLEVGRLTKGEWQAVAEIGLGAALNAMAIDSADLDRDGKDELYITAAYPENLSSRVYVFESGMLKLREKGIRAYFKNVSVPGKGRQLLAQKIGGEGVDYLGGWHQVRVVDGEVDLGDPIVAASDGVPLRSATVSAKGEIIHLSHLDHLEILSSAGERLWLDEEQLGGSEIYFERNDPTQPLQSPDHTRYVYLPTRVERLADGTIVTIANSGNRQLRRARNMTSGLLRAFRWDGVVLRPLWKTVEEDGPVSDFEFADIDNDGTDELILAVQIKGGGFFGGSKGRLVVRELVQP